MKPLLTPAERKRALIILLVYAAITAVFYWWNEVEPSGPCAPSRGLLGLLVTPFIAAGVALISLFRVLCGQKWAFVRLLGHGVAAIILLFLLYVKG